MDLTIDRPATAGFRLADPRYDSFRCELKARFGTSQQMCGTFTRLMCKQFPELKAVAGFYQPAGSSPEIRGIEHWWCEDATGMIHDATADQFRCQGHGRYVRYDPRLHLTAKGTCMNCGAGLVSRLGTYPCSKECDEALAQEYGTRLCGGPYETDVEAANLTCDADVAAFVGKPLPALGVS